MTDKELRKLSRAELLEVLLAQAREIERLNAELENSHLLLQKREIALTQSGNIAEAALRLNGIFEAAQAAADQYLENIKSPVTDTQNHCRQMVMETEKQCDEMLRSARKNITDIWEVIRQEIYNPKLDYTQWQKIADHIDEQLKRK